jgi:hypothetical protein
VKKNIKRLLRDAAGRREAAGKLRNHIFWRDFYSEVNGRKAEVK